MAVDGSSRGDLKSHEGTYSSFITVFKYGAIACFIIAAAVVLLIAS